MNRTRLEKITYLSEVFQGAGITSGMANAMAKTVLDELFPPLAPIEMDKSMGRYYIGLPGDVEVQTKGAGSSYRIWCNGDRMPISTSKIEQDFLTDMALHIRKVYGE